MFKGTPPLIGPRVTKLNSTPLGVNAITCENIIDEKPGKTKQIINKLKYFNYWISLVLNNN